MKTTLTQNKPRTKRTVAQANILRKSLLEWYDSDGRALPWRIRPEDRASGTTPDPYRVWLSEIMLQQTTVAAATPYYQKFLHTYPTVTALANAPLEEVLSLWAGLGYYARARNLHACAKAIAATNATFPTTEKALRALPGIGAYTAAAIAAVCFDEPTNVVDGNVERVMSRLFAVQPPLPGAKKHLAELAAQFVTNHRPGDYAQALMDLGATVCRPKNPDCPSCVWRTACAAYAMGTPTAFPKKTKKKTKPQRFGASYIMLHGDQILLRTRPDKGLLARMAEPPGLEWRDSPWGNNTALANAPIAADWVEATTPITHVFTHFALSVNVYAARLTEEDVQNLSVEQAFWASTNALDQHPLPSVMRKIIAAGLTTLDDTHHTSCLVD